jgi:cytoskeletal protein RodZ
MSTAPHRIRRRPGWLGVIATSVAIFLVVLALLWVRVSGGADPVLGAQASAAQVTSTSRTTASDDDTTASANESATSSSDSTSSSDVPTTQAS